MSNTNLLRSLASVSSMTFLSRCVGFVRDMLMASVFGAGAMTDAFNVAFKLPNLFRRIFAEGAFSQAFVPILAEYKSTKSLSETQSFVASVAGLLMIVLVILTIVGVVFAGGVILITAPGFTADPAKYALTCTLLKITFPYILFISLASLVGSVLNTWGMFTIPAFTPTILNITMIASMLFLRNSFAEPIIALAWAVFAGGVLQLLFQIPYLRRINMPVLPKLDFKNSAVWRVVRLMGPAIFATSVSQISLVINTIFASFLPSGSVSWMYFADRIMEFPSGILGAALATIMLPSLSKHVTAKNTLMFSQTLDWGVRLCLLLALPCSVGLALIAKPITMVLFMHGKFNMFDVLMTERALMAYSVGLLGIILVKIFGPGFYANQNIKTPVKIAIFSLICTQLMNLVFIGPFQHAGLALSIGLAACINAGNLCYLLIKKGLYKPQAQWKIFIIKIVAANLGMAFFIKLSLVFAPFNFAGDNSVRIFSLVVLMFIAMFSYFLSLFVLGFRLRDFKHTS